MHNLAVSYEDSIIKCYPSTGTKVFRTFDRDYETNVPIVFFIPFVQFDNVTDLEVHISN